MKDKISIAFILITFLLSVLVKSAPFSEIKEEKVRKLRQILRILQGEPQCSKTPTSSGICMDEENNIMNWCPDGQMCNAEGKCIKIKFLGEECSSQDVCVYGQCLSSSQGGSTCQLIPTGGDCNSNRECANDNFCFGTNPLVQAKGTCKNYVMEKGGSCPADTECSPQFVCVKGICIDRGTEDTGAEVDSAYQCKSFLATNDWPNVCKGEPDPTDEFEPTIYNASQLFPNMKWGSHDYESLVARDTINMGDKDIYIAFMKNFIKKSAGASESLIECALPVMGDVIFFAMGPLFNLDVSPSDFKKMYYELRGTQPGPDPDPDPTPDPDPDPEPEDDMVCKATPTADGKCYEVVPRKSDPRDSIDYYYHCNSGNYCFGVDTLEESSGTCKPLKAFYGEPCSANTDCLTDKCTDGKCAYKGNGDSCLLSKECGLSSFCENGRCATFQTEGGSCEQKFCAPNLVCVYPTCQRKGSQYIGMPATDADLCETFYYDKTFDPPLCAATPTTGRDIYDELTDMKAKFFKTIDWKNKSLKLSDYMGQNMGSYEYVDKYMKAMIEERQDLKKEFKDCVTPVMRQMYVTGEGYFTLPDADLKKWLEATSDNPGKKDDDDGGLSGGAIAGIIVAVIGGLGVIGGVLYLFVFKQSVTGGAKLMSGDIEK